eukprot:TRINITY_DN2518_c0_g1_i9.p1 TRINITY_DN2518_c0_g1~~TRINITY_DN2518_c0_g1_i9.p1  ORF type:complete len:191 (+),score=58.60 TRINITY_DN2518_c0_g1_i9:61-633(+)
MDELVGLYPDLAASVISEVWKATNDVNNAKLTLQQFRSTEPSEEQIESLLRQLDQFKELGRETILQVLKEHKWDVEDAMMPLWAIHEERNENERGRQNDREQEAERRKRVQRDIEELFKNLPSSVIESILDKNDWDMNAAVDEIFAQRTKQDEEERARRDAEKAKEDEESKRVAELERERQTTVEQLVVK